MPKLEWENLASLLSLATAAVAAGLLFPGVPPRRWIERGEMIFRLAAARRSLCFFVVPALSLVVNAGIAMHNGIARPKVHDEFSYLLAADTFAHGRLTNPSPEFFEHFETPQELMRPTRMSKYPPGQGIALMIGEVICGQPIVGAWIATAAACAAIYWMLLAFVPMPWALLGGIFAALNPALLDWSQDYWGGSVAVLGGALVLGAWGKLMLRASAGASIWLGVALVVLANSRPFEGCLFSVPLLIALLIHSPRPRRVIFVPCAIVLILGLSWMGYYNFRITGNVLRLPYAEYVSQYAVYPIFWFESTHPIPIYHNRSQRWLHAVFDRSLYTDLRRWSTFWPIAWHRVGGFVTDNLKLAALLPGFAVTLYLFRDRRVRWVWISVGAVLVGLLLTTVYLPHYSAPANAAITLLAVMGLAMLRSWQWRGRETGRVLVRAVAIGWLAGAGMCAAEGVVQNSQVIDQLQFVAMKPELSAGRHLIFVNYSPMAELTSGFENEFVYNPANLETSRIIWARYFGPDADLPVATHFAGRQLWLLDIGGKLELRPYLRDLPATGLTSRNRP